MTGVAFSPIYPRSVIFHDCQKPGGKRGESAGILLLGNADIFSGAMKPGKFVFACSGLSFKFFEEQHEF